MISCTSQPTCLIALTQTHHPNSSLYNLLHNTTFLSLPQVLLKHNCLKVLCIKLFCIFSSISFCISSVSFFASSPSPFPLFLNNNISPSAPPPPSPSTPPPPSSPKVNAGQRNSRCSFLLSRECPVACLWSARTSFSRISSQPERLVASGCLHCRGTTPCKA